MIHTNTHPNLDVEGCFACKISGVKLGVSEKLSSEKKRESTLSKDLDAYRRFDAASSKHRAGDLYDLVSCYEDVIHPTGEWNHAEIIANNGDITFKMNDVVVVETTMWDEEWGALVEGSKFVATPDFGTFSSGKLCLQDHGSQVWYRNIKIKRL